MLMTVLCWVMLGLIAGYVASKLINGRGEGVPLDIVLGIVGAMVGGWLFHVIGRAGVTGFNIWSLFIAVVGAIVVLVVWHAIRGRPHQT